VTTHAVNFPTADHLIADISNYDMRRLPRTDMPWVSPECTHTRGLDDTNSHNALRA